jgi:polyisoprenyl-phosphate glycosyltransferase
MNVRYSLVLPIYNEAEVLPLLFNRLDALLADMDGDAEIVMVNDGSRDSSLIKMREKAQMDERYQIYNLSRNFGHQIAITAGMDVAQGDAVIVMDADLQDPPEVILQMIAKWKEGYSVVSAKRVARDGESMFKRATAAIFYRVLQRMSPVEFEMDVGDFRLLDRSVIEAFKTMREQDRFVRGMISWLGFEQTTIEFVRAERAAGETKYPLLKMLKLAADGILGFSDVPLRAALWVGTLVSMLAVFYGLFVISGWFYNGEAVAGWTSTVVTLAFLGGINLLMTGVVGLYVGRVHNQVKNRPLYVLDTASQNRSSKKIPAPITESSTRVKRVSS